MRSLLGLVAAFLAATTIEAATARAQPSASDQTAPTAGSTNIPVITPQGKEVLSQENTRTREDSRVAQAIEGAIDPDFYTCGPGDEFELNFWGAQNFSLRFRVDLEGRIFIAKVGYLEAARKSLTALRNDVKKRVGHDYPGLHFDLTLIQPRYFLVHIVGVVNSPGEYEAHALERVGSLMARAGGIAGSRRRILIERRDGTTKNADLVEYELTGDTQYNPQLLDGDVIRIQSTELVVSVEGAVRRPGKYELISTKDLKEALELAGGVTSSAARDFPFRIVRRNAAQRPEYVDVAQGAGSASEALHDDDQLVIRSASELQPFVYLFGAVTGANAVDGETTVRRLPYVEGDTVGSLLDRAGGISAPGDLKRAYISRARTGGTAKLEPLDLEALLLRRDLSADKKVSIGDTIVVPALQHAVSVEGAVSRGGTLAFNPQFSVTEYIARAGGLTRSAQSLSAVKVVDTNGHTRSYQRGMLVAPGDSIMVPERSWSRPEIVQLVFASASLLLSTVAITYALTR